ncbi:MAG: hypothetical protein ACI8W8_003624 [Rhodothermales bacterium]|jgi:hypothetical protein
MSNGEKPIYKDEISPDSLMRDFRGRGVITILIFTLVIHGVIILCTSFGYLKTEVLGADTDTMSKEELVDAAVKEATVSIRGIAEKYGLSPQEISDRFAKGGSRTDKVMSETAPETDPAEPATTPTTPTPEPAKPLSEIEKTIQESQQGPAIPDMQEDEDDDLF